MMDAGADPQDTIMIGDTVFDIIMGRSIQVASVGVAWGYHEASELLASGADAVADDTAHLGAILESLREPRA